MLCHYLTNLEIQKYCQNEPRFNGVSSRDNMPKKQGMGLYFVIKLKLFIVIVLVLNIFWLQGNKSVMCGYFCIEFTDFMRAGKRLTDFTSLFSPYDFKKNEDIILSYFKDEWNW